jgi:hypothetical protein
MNALQPAIKVDIEDDPLWQTTHLQCLLSPEHPLSEG